MDPLCSTYLDYLEKVEYLGSAGILREGRLLEQEAMCADFDYDCCGKEVP